MPFYKKTLFIFRRDLRLPDNRGLISALQSSELVIPCFIFTPEQIESNPYLSPFCLQFMIESLQDLQKQLKERTGYLYFFYGKPEEIVTKCIQKLDVDAVFANRDYTPYSQARDNEIKKSCNTHQIPFNLFDDNLLQSPEDTLKSNGKPYTIFTPFFKNSSHLDVAKPQANMYTNYFHDTIPFANEALIHKILPKNTPHLILPGGRTAGLKILKNIGNFANYALVRDFPEKNGTTHLSAYLKFNVCSIREVYYAICKALGKNNELIRQLYWRDFFSTIALFFPYVFKGCFHKKFDRLNWNQSKENFQKWCEGRTGIPIVDAGMRELNQTGFMQNRVRMITASFLVKDLHINWQWGEQYFAQKLIDYDPAVNNGNWQWAASTGCDAQPYFRIFNPWIQQKKFDPECLYIKKWIPELDPISAKVIHAWHQQQETPVDYPPPMVDHSKESQVCLAMYLHIPLPLNSTLSVN